jgi:hypothetical protein
VNDADAVTCQHCGAKLGEKAGAPTTRQVNESFEITRELSEQVVKEYTLPSKGMALFLLNRSQPVAICMEAEFVLGRAGEFTTEYTIDLTSFDGFVLGVSRRHALIRAVGEKYVLVDLNSSNGTWLDGQRLVPTKPYDLPKKGVIQLGRMSLVAAYVKPVEPKK